MKIAILTNFRGLDVGLSYRNTTLSWQEELILQGYDATLFVRQETEIDKSLKWLNIRAEMPKVKTRKFGQNEKKDEQYNKDVQKLLPFFTKVVSEFDVVITHDFTLLKMYVVMQDALRKALFNVYGENNNKAPKILNVYHSNLPIAEQPKTVEEPFTYPERLRFTPFPYSRPVSLSHASAQEIANCLHLPHRAVGVLPNPAVSPSHELVQYFGTSWLSSDTLQIMPFCATRWDSKGVKTLLKIFGHFKANGIKPFLMCVTQNGKHKHGRECCESIRRFGEDKCELVYGEHFLVTSLECGEWASGVPNQYVNELQTYADLFIFASKCEMCPNILLEAQKHGQFVVIPENLRVAHELTPPSTIVHNLPVDGSENYPQGQNAFFAALAKELWAELEMDRSVQQRRWARQQQNRNRLFKKYFEPLLHGSVPYQYTDLSKRPVKILDDKI